MGRQAQADEDEDWETADEPALDDDPVTDDAAVDSDPRGQRRAPPCQTMTRRLIEQARETRELNRCLADFEDYVV
jgi:hypothetical protein